MKSLKLSILLFVFALMALPGYSADLIVEENAIPPNYSSIQNAVNAASPGDRIFIKNKGQNVPWIETVVVDRPVSLLPLDPVAGWLLTGGISIAPDITKFSPTNNEITILGAHIYVGSILTTTASNSLADFARLSIVSCQLVSGIIDIDDRMLHTHVSGNLLVNGDITIGYGVVSGNQVNGSIVIADINNATPDTTYVVGNRLINAGNGTNVGRIYCTSSENFIHVANNYIRYGSYGGQALYVTALKSGFNGGNTIENNTIEYSGAIYNYGIYLASVPASTQVRIENNAIYDTHTGEGSSISEYAVYCSGISSTAVVIVNYNVHRNWGGSANGGLINLSLATLGLYTLGNTISTTMDGTVIDDITGACTDTDCINVGSPDNRHTDLDLTQNDRGTAGGSFHYDNFWPILTGGARVYLVKTPRSVIQGSTINAEADAYDR